MDFSVNEQRLLFRKICLLSRVGIIACKHRITPVDMRYLDFAVPELLHILEAEGESRTNNHYLIHLTYVIRYMGVPRDYWGMPYESKHSKLLPIKYMVVGD